MIVGLIASGVYSAAVGLFPFQKIIPSSLLGIGLIALFGFSYVKAGRTDAR